MTSTSAPSSAPAGDGASPTSPPAKSARSSEAGSDADGNDDGDALSPQDFPSLADAAAVPARRRGGEWQEVTRGGKEKGKGKGGGRGGAASPSGSAPAAARDFAAEISESKSKDARNPSLKGRPSVRTQALEQLAALRAGK